MYLAGKMSGMTLEEMNAWRLRAVELLGEFYHIINPCDYYTVDADRTVYPDGGKEFNITELEVKEYDLWAVEHSDIILVNFDYPDSIGTAIEIHMAHEVWKKPVIAFGGASAYIHPWVRFCATKRCETVEDAVDYIHKFYTNNF